MQLGVSSTYHTKQLKTHNNDPKARLDPKKIREPRFSFSRAIINMLKRSLGINLTIEPNDSRHGSQLNKMWPTQAKIKLI